MQQKKKPDVDVIMDVLNEAIVAYPKNNFLKSISMQYQERGGLSKKQLEGLFGKAKKIKGLPPGKLATLEAIILKKPTRFKSTPPPPKPLFEKDEKAGQMIDIILGKLPEHKRVLYFRNKYDNNEQLSPLELTELEKFYKVLSQLKK